MLRVGRCKYSATEVQRKSGGLVIFLLRARLALRPGSSDRGRPADVNPPEADLVGVEAVGPQVAEDEGLDRTRSHALLTLP